MTAWTSLWLPVLVTSLWLWIPGLPLALGLRFRPIYAYCTAPLFSIAIISVAAIMAPLLGLAWGPLPPILLTIILWAAFWGPRLAPRVRRAGRAGTRESRRTRRTTRGLLTSTGALSMLALIVSGALMLHHVGTVLGRPDAISQTFDNIFHLNAVRWILDTGEASSLTLSSMTTMPGQAAFYPGAWHGIVSLVLLTIGSGDVVLGTNALIVVTCALVWPAGIVLMIRATLPTALRPFGILPGSVLVAAMPMFPFIFLGFGVLLPNLLGIALLPATIALFLRFVGLLRIDRVPFVATMVGGLFAAIAISLAHPNASMSLIALAIPITIVAFVRAVERLLHRRVTWHSAAVLLVLAIGVCLTALALWPILRPPEDTLTWHPVMAWAEAIGQALTMSTLVGRPAWLLTALFVAGIYAAIRHRLWVLPAMWLVATTLWVAVAAWPAGEERTALVGVWYNDPYRLTAVLALPSVPLMALGAGHFLRWLMRAVPRPRRPVVDVAGAVAGALALIVGTQSAGWMNHIVDYASAHYRMSDESPLLTVDEYELIQRLPETLPPGAVVVTDAWNGSSMAYALTGVETTSTHTLTYTDPATEVLEQHLDEAAVNPAVCAAVETTQATHVLDFGDQQINDSDVPMLGFDDVDEAAGFTLVDSEGDAALYRIDACG